jgi:hypothetical protein
MALEGGRHMAIMRGSDDLGRPRTWLKPKLACQY